jgi:hypothetical protein
MLEEFDGCWGRRGIWVWKVFAGVKLTQGYVHQDSIVSSRAFGMFKKEM